MEASVKSTVNSFTRSCLYQQGFSSLNDVELRRLNLPLRFTPAICSILVIVGLIFQSPALLFVLAGVGLLSAAFPRGNVIDRFYNLIISRLVGSAPLPPNTPQRRFACGIGATFAAAAGFSFLAGLPGLAYIFGGFMIAASLTVTTTQWCLGSWLYNLIFGKTKTTSA